jgi:Holliday junction DNA helicase RuvB
MQNSLRPLNFNEFIGQKKLKKTLKVIIESSIKRKKQLDHILFYGRPGLGKTSLAKIISNKIKTKIRYAQGPLLEKKSDILTLFCSIQKGDLIFIDEIHGINKKVEEIFYSALEDNIIDVFIGPEGDQKLIRMKLPKFTLIGATTLFSKMTQPFKDRFGFIGKFSNYTKKDIEKIIKNSSKKLKIKIDKESIEKIALYSRNIPRIANNLLKRS